MSDGMRKLKLSQTFSKLFPQARKEQITINTTNEANVHRLRMVTRKGQTLKSAVARSAQATFDVVPVAERNGRSGGMWGARARSLKTKQTLWTKGSAWHP